VPEYRVVPLDGGHCVINDGADLRLGRIAFVVGQRACFGPQKIDRALYWSLSSRNSRLLLRVRRVGSEEIFILRIIDSGAKIFVPGREETG